MPDIKSMGGRPPITTDAKRKRQTGEHVSLHTHISRSLFKRARVYAVQHDVSIERLVTDGLEWRLGQPAPEVTP